MGYRRPRSAYAEATKWSATAITSFALIAWPLGRVALSGAEAFVLSSGARSSCPEFVGLAIEQAWVDRPTRAGVPAVAIPLAGRASDVRWPRSSRRAAGGVRLGEGSRRFCLGDLRMGTPEGGGEWGGDGDINMDMSGMRDDEKFPDKPSVFPAADGTDGEQGMGEPKTYQEEEEEEGNGIWSDAEVERRVAERRVVTVDPYATEEEEDEDDGEGYLEIVANMTKPLGITIEASTDKAELIYITSVGEQAEARGLEEGDVLTGVSAVFGEDVWSVKGKSIDKVRSMVRCRREPYVLVRVERGHVSLEERCKDGFGINPNEDCWRLTEDGECEVGYSDLWTSVYEEELAVLQGDTEAGGGVRGGGEKRRKNEPPPPKDAGLGWDDSWMENDF